MSNLSELLPSGGGQNVVEFTASGTVASGKPVILNTNGTVTQVAESAVSESFGSQQGPGETSVDPSLSIYVPSVEAVIVLYRNGSGYLTGVVGTVSGETVTYGTPVVIRSASTDIDYVGVAYDSDNGYVCVSYQGSSNYVTLVMLYGITTSTFSTSSEFIVRSSGSSATRLAYDTTNSKLVCVWDRVANLFSKVITITPGSPPTASAGSEVSVRSTYIDQSYDVGFDASAGSIVIGYNWTQTTDVEAIAGQVSGTSISFGTESGLTGGSKNSSQSIRVIYDSSASKTLIVFSDTGAGAINHIPLTITGTSISNGTFTTETTYVNRLNAIYYGKSSKTVVFGTLTTATQDINTYLITISGTSSSISSRGALVSSTGTTPDLGRPAYVESENNVLEPYVVSGNTIQSKIYTPAHNVTNLTAASFIGLAADAISDTATGDINVKGGINEAQTGLTIGSDYYVQVDGTLSTTSSSVKVGQAISATTINMMDLT
jgi:hypothetical protein